MKLLDHIEFKPDNFTVAPQKQWRLFGLGPAKRAGTQPRFCAPNCEHYIKDKDGKCGRFYECSYYVFDMHQIEKGDAMVLIMFATENDPPHDGLSWWVSEQQLIDVLGARPNGMVDQDLGRKIIDNMLAEYNALNAPPTGGTIIR